MDKLTFLRAMSPDWIIEEEYDKNTWQYLMSAEERAAVGARPRPGGGAGDEATSSVGAPEEAARGAGAEPS